MLSFSSFILSFSAFLIGSVLAFPPDDSDLTTFVTRPDIKAPRFDVKIHNKDHVSPGYWFVAPYWQIPPEMPTSRFTPCQIGPHIYDGNGSLVWTGACRFDNANIFDFRTVVIDNTTYLSFIHGNDLDVDAESGHGLILDEKYHEKNKVPNAEHVPVFNMHEFNVVDNGKSALSTSYINRLLDLKDWNIAGEGWVTSGGILDQDVATGEVIFQWDGYENIPLHESTIDWPWDPPALPGWDYLHVNSVDKTPDGNYLLSSRFTDTVYMITKEGEIGWRLGGTINDFEYTNHLMFHRQHHVRHVESNSTHMTIQMLNNASDEYYQDGEPTSVLFIQLDVSASPMTATLLRKYDRPDKRLTRLRGSAQTLPDGNIFAGWSANGYQSEFTPDGELVMEAWFVSDRYSTYRAWKSEWTGRPTTPPAIKSAAFGSTAAEVSTAIWVSWNGATDIDSWNFYGRASSDGESVLIGNAPKTGFETQFMASGYMGWIEAEALDAEGNVLGKSDVEETNAPENWQASGFNVNEEAPGPMDPSVIMKNKEEANTELAVGGDSKQQPVSNKDPAGDSSSSGGLVIFCIALAIVVGSGILLGLFWFFRPQLKQRSEKKTYLPVSSEADGDDGRYDRTL